MKLGLAAFHAAALAGLLTGPVAAAAVQSSSDLALRALPNAPDGYAPEEVTCPSNRPRVRHAATVSPEEKEWLKKRRSKTTSALKDFFGHASISGFDAAKYIKDNEKNTSALPNIGIAVSGGGYRALMNGGGAIKAFDSRTKNSTSKGHLGGLLQSATYVAGLSGGGWLLGSIYVNNFTTITDLVNEKDGSVWEFSKSILEGPKESGVDILNTAEYYKDISKAVGKKKDAGFEISITDYWGRALSYQLINAKDGGPSYTWSSIALNQGFKDGDQPMPLLVADGRNPGEKVIGGNATVFEFNPYEFGTFDPTVFGFVPLEYIGSRFSEGTLPKNESCVRGLDNAGYVMGTSSSLFNQFALRLDSVDMPSFVKDTLKNILKDIGDENNDIAEYKPNPFYRYAKQTSPFFKTPSLPLVDGGEDGQNVPLHPLVQPERNVDVIFAVDSSADNKYNWPNGSALIATYARSKQSIANGTDFPAVPDVNTFINLGLNTRPTFFGCNSSNTTGHSPLIVYIPNAPYSAFSNVSTFTLDYKDQLRNEIIQNGYDVATMGNGTKEENWSSCVSCAILSRSFERTNTKVPDVCKDCFNKHCWDGKTNSTSPEVYAPSISIKKEKDKKSAASGLQAASSKLSIVAALCATAVSALFW